MVYISTDIETNGLTAGIHSMLQLGSVALDEDGNLLGKEFTANLLPLEDLTSLPSTMEWWATRPETYAVVVKDAEPAEVVMPHYLTWLEQFSGPVVFVGYPADFDAAFVRYYLWRFTGSNIFGHGAVDIKTLAMALMNVPYTEARKRTWPPRWFKDEKLEVAHLALDDAREQAYEFAQILKELQTRNANAPSEISHWDRSRG